MSNNTVFDLRETEETARGVAEKFEVVRVSCAEFVGHGVEEIS